MGDLGGESLVVHQEEIQLVYIMDEELFQTIGEEVAGLPV